VTVRIPPSPLGSLRRDARIYVAGHRGLVGSALWRHLRSSGLSDLVGRTSDELDLRDRDPVRSFTTDIHPGVIIDAAAKVGGILANSSYAADFLSDNLRIQVNLLDSAQAAGVPRFLFLGSICIYPKFAGQPIREDSLLTGALEPTNDAHAIAKIAGILQVHAIRRQFGLHYISAMPTNLYRPGDNFHARSTHVLPELIRPLPRGSRSGRVLRHIPRDGKATPGIPARRRPRCGPLVPT
jgi:GDP-L-fucose synthase